MEKRQIAFVHVETKKDSDGLTYTEVRDKSGKLLAAIFYLEDDDYHYRYSVELSFGWADQTFETEAKAIEFICGGIKPLIEFGEYYNSEIGHLQHIDYGK